MAPPFLLNKARYAFALTGVRYCPNLQDDLRRRLFGGLWSRFLALGQFYMERVAISIKEEW